MNTDVTGMDTGSRDRTASRKSMEIPVSAVIKQHLIDPETCMRCNTCESNCTI